ncbi:hypothetical protein ACHAXN_005648 [Cyclotella atomus]|jgi:4-hydroxy-4-methyl-2-oxoglutarate aldolase
MSTTLVRGMTRPHINLGFGYLRSVHSYLPGLGHGAGRMTTLGRKDPSDPSVQNEKLMARLKSLATGPLCDSDKLHRQIAKTTDIPELKSYEGLRLMCPSSMTLRNPLPKHEIQSKGKSNIMVGIARTCQLTRTNDFLGVLYALSRTKPKDVLVVNSCGSTRAVAGSLFAAEAARRGLRGIVIDGPVRDVDDLSTETRVYSTMVSPYAGTVQHVGEGIDVTPVICGGVEVNPGDIVFGDTDGVLVGSAKSFSICIHEAENIMSVEKQLMEGMRLGVSLHAMTNFDEHIQLRKEGQESSLEFKDLNTIKFDAEPLHMY